MRFFFRVFSRQCLTRSQTYAAINYLTGNDDAPIWPGKKSNRSNASARGGLLSLKLRNFTVFLTECGGFASNNTPFYPIYAIYYAGNCLGLCSPWASYEMEIGDWRFFFFGDDDRQSPFRRSTLQGWSACVINAHLGIGKIFILRIGNKKESNEVRSGKWGGWERTPLG